MNRKTKYYVLSLPLIALLFSFQSNKEESSDPEVILAHKIDSVLNLMTPAEKFGQLNLIPYYEKNREKIVKGIKNGSIGSLLKSSGVKKNRELQKIAVEETRLGIPLIFQEDVIHGYKTIAPIPLGESASWDLEAIKESSAVAALEASAAGVHLTYAPMVDICRDPRWGRIMEGAGEDPYLGMEIAKARVQGFQGEELDSENTVMACVKHFAGYGDALAGRDYYINDFSERAFRELYLPPFQAAIDAGVGSIMTAYTSLDGIPASASKYLLHDVLREEMQFDGMVITDWKTILNIVTVGVAEDETTATQMAIEAGIDVDMTSEILVRVAPDLLKEGKITIERIDKSVRQVLKAKFLMGLFDDPYKYFNEEREKNTLLSKENIAKTRDMARKSMVLLKNEKNTLPFNKNIKTIAVIGPLGKSKKDLLAWWSCEGEEKDVVSLWEGIKNKLPDAKVLYAKGCNLGTEDTKEANLLPEALKIAKEADVIIMALGERYYFSGETCSMADINLTQEQQQLLEEISNLKKPTVSVIFSGRPMILTPVDKNSDAILEVWLPGTTGGDATADVLFGDYNPSGKLPVTFPYHQGQIPIYYSYRRNQTELPHIDAPNDPLYPFGYGLSYTKYEYSSISLSDSVFTANDSISASVVVKNSGERTGEEIIQLYIGDEVCSIIRPIKELKDFRKIALKAGESKKVSFTISVEDLYFIGRDYKKRYEAGKFKVYIGTNSQEVSEATFYLK